MKDKIVMPLWTCCLFIVVMNTTMFNVSLPVIIHDLQITSDLGLGSSQVIPLDTPCRR